MNKKIIMVEDFYTQPEKIRKLALEEEYASVAKLNYPGYQSHKVFNSKSLVSRFEKLIGANIDVDTDRFTFGGFRLITDETGKMPKIHADTIDWAAMIFLTPNAPSNAGIGFYKHKETGFEGPPSDEEARKLGFEDSLDFEEKIIYRDQADIDKWELISSISPTYNRLVMFKGRELYHAPISGFGSTPEDCRITHNFFFMEDV